MYSIEEFDEKKTKVLKYIIYKMRTEQEVIIKFQNEIDEILLEDIIQYLKETNYINDKRYIEKTINNYMQLKNLSLTEIKYKLMMKGVKKNLIEEYFYENEEELKDYEIKSAYNLIQKKQEFNDIEIKNYLLKKGYHIDNIEIAIEEKVEK